MTENEGFAGLGNPWERAWIKLPAESDEAHRAYQIYRDLGEERSCARVGQELGKSRTLMTRWCSKHEWVERAQLFDDYENFREREIREKIRLENVESNAKTRQEILETVLRSQLKAAKVAERMIDHPLTKQERIVEGPDGEEVTLLVNPAGWSKNTAINYMNMALAAVTGSLKNIDQVQEPEQPLEVAYDNLTEDDIQAWLDIDAKLHLRRKEE